MKKDHTILTKIFIIFALILPKSVEAETFSLPDWNFYNFRENYKITKSADEVKYEKIRNNYNFDNYFDKQTIILHKKTKNLTPQNLGKSYLARTLMGDKTCETYILRDEKDCFYCIYCSQKLQKCEILKFIIGFDGIIEIRYTHNNLWHFQNNIGSFLETQNRVNVFPNLLFANYIQSKYLMRLEK